MWIWDALAYLFFAFVMGAFAFWVTGYFLVESVKYFFNGPSEQLKTVGTSILDEAPLEARFGARTEPPIRRAA